MAKKNYVKDVYQKIASDPERFSYKSSLEVAGKREFTKPIDVTAVVCFGITHL